MADERFVVQYKKKEEKCKKWKNFIDIKKSIVFCSALGGILGALVGIPAGGAVCGGVMGTNAQDSLKSLVDWFIGPSEDDKKKYDFYKRYEDKYLSYAREYAGNNNANVNFDKSKEKLLLGIQEEIESCYNSYCHPNEDDDTEIDMDEIINKNINTGKGKVVNSLKQIAPDEHISTDMNQEDKNFMHDLYEKIKSHKEIKITFVDKCSPEQNNKNRDTKSDTLYLSRDMFKKVYKVFTNTRFEKEKMPTEDNLYLFYQTHNLLFGNMLDGSFRKDFVNKKNFSLEEDTFSLKKIPHMKWKVKKMMVNERPSATKTLEYFFADISNYIRKNKDKGLTGDTKSTRENISVQNLGDKYGNFAEKQFNNLKSSVNKTICAF